MTFSYFLANEESTKRFAEDFALSLVKGDLVTLQGDLGAGKTSLARAMVRTLVNDADMEVPSPTFTLVQVYEAKRFSIVHADLYRIGSPEEIDELGFEEAKENGIVLVEWPEKAEGDLGQADFAVTLDHEGKGRRITIEASGNAAHRLERSLTIRSFLEKHGRGDSYRQYFTGDASARSYELIEDHGVEEVLMNAPQMEMPDSKGQSYAEIAHLGTDIRQFIGIDRLILQNGFVAPQILAGDPANGLLLLEDLGRNGILDSNGKPIAERYIEAAKLLADFHQKNWPEQHKFDDFTLNIPHYDNGVLQAELSLLLDWYLPYLKTQPLDKAKGKEFYKIWQPFCDLFETAEQTFVMRDYHSPNIIWRENEIGSNKIGLLDFQDGQIGPTAYDVASLAQDARVAISSDLEATIIDAYCTSRKQMKRPFDEAKFRMIYAIAGAQRVSKILGIFVRLDKRDGKPGYLKYLPHMRDYLKRNLQHPSLKPLQQFYLETGLLDE